MTIEPAIAGARAITPATFAAEVEQRQRELTALRDQLGYQGADAGTLRVFAMVSVSLDLDPFGGQIALIKRSGVYRPTITVAGRRALADRTGRLQGIEGPWWTGPRDERGELHWRDTWDEDGEPYAARCLVHVEGWEVPANGTAKWSEFAQLDNRGALMPTWAAMPSHMLGKVAEAMALRRGFPEVARAVAYGGQAWPAARVDVDPDDAAVIAEAAVDGAQAIGDADGPSEGQRRLITSYAEALGLDVGRPLGELTGDEARQLIEELRGEMARRRAAE